MQRSGLLVIAILSGATLMSSSAFAQQNMGGGFIEFLFSGGQAARPPWCEHHLLMFGDLRRIVVLARRFRQHAILLVRTGAPSRLLVLR